MAYLVDGILILIFVLSVLAGHWRGFIKTLSGLVAFVAALAVSMLLSGPVAQLVYNTAVEPGVVSAVEEYAISTTASLESGVDEALASLPAFVTNLLSNNGILSGADVLDKVDIYADRTGLAQQIADQVVEPVVFPLIKMLCTLILFLVVYIVALILLRVLDVVAKLPVLNQLNKGLGAVAGAVTGALWVLFAVSLLQVAAAFGGSDFVFSQAVLSDTMLANWLIGINPIGSVLQQIVPAVE